MRWEFREHADAWAVCSTAGGLVFSGDGQETSSRWTPRPGKISDIQLGASINTAAVSFSVDGRQDVAIAAGDALFAFALPKES